jgi:KH domain
MHIDVSFSDHSTIIGKGGRNINQIMKSSSALVHFPDSNNYATSNKMKSNKVCITGSFLQVEKARTLIRLEAPLLISFELVNEKDCPKKRELKTVGNKFGVEITEHKRSKPTPQMLLVKGLQKDHVKVIEATNKLKHLVYGDASAEIPVECRMIPPQGKFLDESQVKIIMAMTNTDIKVPETHGNTRNFNKSMQLKVSGSIYNVYKAFQMVQDYKPITLKIEVPDFRLNDEIVCNLINLYKVRIEVSKIKRVSIQITGIEKHIQSIYLAGLHLLDIDADLKDPDHEHIQHEKPTLLDLTFINKLIKRPKLIDKALSEMGYERYKFKAASIPVVPKPQTSKPLSTLAAPNLNYQPSEEVLKAFQLQTWFENILQCQSPQQTVKNRQTDDWFEQSYVQQYNTVPFNGSLAPGDEFKSMEKSKMNYRK